MRLRFTTPVPNSLFAYLPTLTLSEVKVLLVVVRQTNGWIDKRTGLRKQYDWIAHSQFMKKTGLSRRSVIHAIDTLVTKQLIRVSVFNGRIYVPVENRQGKKRLYYGLGVMINPTVLVQKVPTTCARSCTQQKKL